MYMHGEIYVYAKSIFVIEYAKLIIIMNKLWKCMIK